MLGLLIISGARRTWQKVCSRFASCYVFELLSPQSPGTTQAPRKLQGAAEGHHHLHSCPLLQPAAQGKQWPGSTQPSQWGSFTWVKNLQIWGGLEGSWTGAAPRDRVQVAQLFSTAASAERALVLP